MSIRFDFFSRNIIYVKYENTAIILADQLYNFENMDSLREALLTYIPQDTGEIIFKTDLKQQNVIIQITSARQVNPDNLDEIQQTLLILREKSQSIFLELYEEGTGDLYYRTEI